MVCCDRDVLGLSPPPAVEAAEALVLTADKTVINPGGSITVKATNNTASEVSGIRFSSSVSSGSVVITLAADPETVTIPSGESRTVTITAPSTALTSSFVGQVSATFGSAVATLAIKLSPPETAATAVKKSTVNMYSWFPWPRSPKYVDSDDLKLAGSACTTAPPPFAVGSGSALLNVKPTCLLIKCPVETARSIETSVAPQEGSSTTVVAQANCEPTALLHLKVTSFDWNQHHSFVGTMSSGGADTELTVRYSTVFLWPVFALIAGLVVAVWAASWTTGRRDLRLVKLRLLDLQRVAGEADAAFRTSAAGQTWNSYEISTSVHSDVTEHLATLEDIASSGTYHLVTDTQKTELQLLVKEAAPLETLVEKWPTANKDIFEPLRNLRNDTTSAAAWAAMGATDKWLDDTLEPSTDNTAVEATEYIALFAETAQMANALALVKGFLYDKERLVNKATQAPDAEKVADTQATQRDLDQLLGDSRNGLAPSAVMALKPKFDGFRTEVNRLPVPMVTETVTVDRYALADDEEALVRQEYVQPLSPADSLRATITATDLRVVAIVGLVAVWSGLQALYFGKAWGNVIDYASAFLWTFTATTVLAPLITALTQRNSTRFRLIADD